MKGFLKVLTIIIVLGALVGGVVLVRKNQETRRGAYNAQAEFFLQGSIPNNLQVNSTFPVPIFFDAKSSPVNSMAFTIEVGDTSVAEVVGVQVADGLFTNVIQAGAVSKAAKVSGLINKIPASLPSGVFLVGTMMVKANGTGTATFKLGTYVVSTSLIKDGDNKITDIGFRGQNYPIGSGGGNSAWLKFDPNVGYVELNETKQIKVILDSKEKKISAVKLNLLFDPAMTEMISFVGTTGYSSQQSSVDNTSGKVLISMTAESVSAMRGGEVWLGTLSFKPKEEGGDQFVVASNGNQVTDNLGNTLTIVGGNTDFVYENNVTYSCSDSDNGRNYQTRGMVDAVTTNGSDAVHDTGEDTCTSTSVLTEYYCDSGDKKAFESHTCEQGTTCTAGACVNPNAPTATPTDTQYQPTATPTTDEDEDPDPTPTVEDEDEPDPTSTPVVQASPTPTTQPASGDDSVFNFAITFAGLSGEAKCWTDPSVTLTMMGSDQKTHVFKDVPIQLTNQKSNGLSVFVSSVRLPGFKLRSNIAAFVKGPQHAQVKFGKNGQDAFYNQSGGTLTLTSDEDDSPVYDFTKYAILAGDFTGESEGVPDGKIDGRDFSFIKERVSAIKEVEENSLGDVNGDCVINSWDLGTFMKSFNEKMDQMY